MIFKIKLAYFKPTGKLYTSAEIDLDVTDCGPKGYPSCYMHEVTDWVRNANLNGALPGLSRGVWDGPVFVDCDDGYPCLVLPEYMRDAARDRENAALRERWL